MATSELVKEWRERGPIAWAEGAYGWTGDDGKSIMLTPWQHAALAAWWERRADVSTFAMSNVKKTGKTFCNAVLLCWRWLALPGEHFAVGNDLDQSAGRQFQQIAEMVRRNPYLARNVKINRNQLTFEPTGATLTALPADYTGASGANFITASYTEAWGIVYENGRRMWEEMTPIPGRFYGLPCLRIVDSYGGFLGESETWHKLIDRGLAGDRVPGDWPIFRDGGLLLFHMEGEDAQARCYRGASQEATAYYTEQRASLRPNAYARLHENKRAENESRFVTREQWQACYSPDVRPWRDGDGRALVLGADASTTRDLTALVGCVWDPEARRAEVIYSKTWSPMTGEYREGKPTIDLEYTIGAEVLRLHDLGAVDRAIYDPYQLHSVALGWERAGVRCVEMPQTSARVESDQALYDAIIGRTLAHCGDPVLTEHVCNAVAVETSRGFRLAKEKTSKKIDAAVALSMAHHGACGQSNVSHVSVVTLNFGPDGRLLIEPGDNRMSKRIVNGKVVEVQDPPLPMSAAVTLQRVGGMGWLPIQRRGGLYHVAPDDVVVLEQEDARRALAEWPRAFEIVQTSPGVVVPRAA